MRVVPNLYPAFERQEVVVHSPRHLRSVAELADDEIHAVAEAWHARIEAARAEGFPYVQVLINEGRDAGASLPHNHSQLVWMREPPAVPGDEYARLEEAACALCAVLEDRSPLEIAVHGGVAAVSHPAARTPHEVLVAPSEHRPDGDPRLYEAVLTVLRDVIRRLHAVEGPAPFNAWAHPGGHWHLELVPRLSILAGLELGAGIYVNWLPPEEAAAALRDVSI